MKVIIALISFGLALGAAHASETVKGAKKDLDAFKKEMTVKLEATEKKLAELKIKAKAKGDAAQEKTVAELEQTKEKLQAELSDLKDDTKSSWTKFKAGLADSVDRLNAKIQKSLKE